MRPAKRPNHWRRRLGRLLGQGLLFLLLILALDWWRAPRRDISLPPVLYSLQGEALPLGTPASPAGTRQPLPSPRSGPLLIYVWAEWCVFCRHTTPAVQALSADYPVIGLALRSGDAVAVQSYMKRHGWTFPVANDPDGELFRRLDLRVVPTALIVKDGRLLYSTSGWSSSWGLRLRLWLARFF